MLAVSSAASAIMSALWVGCRTVLSVPLCVPSNRYNFVFLDKLIGCIERRLREDKQAGPLAVSPGFVEPAQTVM